MHRDRRSRLASVGQAKEARPGLRSARKPRVRPGKDDPKRLQLQIGLFTDDALGQLHQKLGQELVQRSVQHMRSGRKIHTLYSGPMIWTKMK